MWWRRRGYPINQNFKHKRIFLGKVRESEWETMENFPDCIPFFLFLFFFGLSKINYKSASKSIYLSIFLLLLLLLLFSINRYRYIFSILASCFCILIIALYSPFFYFSFAKVNVHTVLPILYHLTLNRFKHKIIH